MPQAGGYLSTDPNAGLGGGYLSTDPNAGMSRDDELQRAVDAAKGARENERKIRGEQPSLGSQIGAGLLQSAKNVASIPLNLAKVAWEESQKGGSPAMFGPRLAGRLIVQPAVEQGRKSKDALSQGRYSEAAGHGLAAALPVLGPQAADIGEKIGTGNPEKIVEALGDVGSFAVSGPAARLAGRFASKAGSGAQSAAESGWLRVAKINVPIAKRTNTYRKTKDLEAAESEIAKTVLDSGLGNPSRANVATARGKVAQAGDDIGNAIAEAGPANPRAAVLAARQEARTLQSEGAPSTQVAAAKRRAAEIRDHFSETVPGGVKGTARPNTKYTWEDEAGRGGEYAPIEVTMKREVARSVPAGQLHEFAKGTGKRNANRFAAPGENAPAIAQVDMAAGKAGRAELNRNPRVAAANQRFSEARPAADALVLARRRMRHQGPLGILQSGAAGAAGLGAILTGNPLVAAAALPSFLLRDRPMMAMSQKLYNVGKKSGKAGRALNSAEAARAALIAQLLGQDE